MKRRIADRELWERVRRTVEPLHRERREPGSSKPDFGELFEGRGTEPEKKRGQPTGKNPTANSQAGRPMTRKPGPAIQPLDEKTARKIARGRIWIDATLDLHGMTQEAARFHLHRFLARSQEDGHRTVLVITGKGHMGQGVLRRMVPHWLMDPDLRGIVSGHGPASPQHGGSGALYIRIKRKR